MLSNFLSTENEVLDISDKNILVCYSGPCEESDLHIEHLSLVSECDVNFGGIIDLYILNNEVIYLRDGKRVAFLLKNGLICDMSMEFNNDYFYKSFLNNKNLFYYLSTDCVYYNLYKELYMLAI